MLEKGEGECELAHGAAKEDEGGRGGVQAQGLASRAAVCDFFLVGPGARDAGGIYAAFSRWCYTRQSWSNHDRLRRLNKW